jgi:hypothetical protein
VTRIRARRPRNCGSIPCTGKRLLPFSEAYKPAKGPTHVQRTCFPEGKASISKADHSSQFCTEVKNEWGYASCPRYNFKG